MIVRFLIVVLGTMCLPALAETFADVFKPRSLSYLYKLVDEHPEKRKHLEHLFKIKKTYNVKKIKNKKVIAYSLFWKNLYSFKPAPVVNAQRIYYKNDSVKNNESFFRMYVKPLITQIKNYKKLCPGWIIRIYLAHDLQFLIPKLRADHVEIFVMESNSIAASPGSMWRFLVLDDPSVAMIQWKDADTGEYVYTSAILAWMNSKRTKGFFRIREFEQQLKLLKFNMYSPIGANSFGAKHVRWINAKKAMQGFILHRTLFPYEKRHVDDTPQFNHPYGHGNEFPSYGFDERFLKHVVYFEAVKRNELALILRRPLPAHLKPDNWIMMDLKFAKSKPWLNK